MSTADLFFLDIFLNASTDGQLPSYFRFCITLSLLFLLKNFFWGGRAQAGGGREMWTDDLIPSLQWQSDSSKLYVGFDLTNCDIMAWAKVWSSIDWATQVPPPLFINFIMVLSEKSNLLKCFKIIFTANILFNMTFKNFDKSWNGPPKEIVPRL